MSNFAIDPMGEKKTKIQKQVTMKWKSYTPNGVQNWGENPAILDNLLGSLSKKKTPWNISQARITKNLCFDILESFGEDFGDA